MKRLGCFLLMVGMVLGASNVVQGQESFSLAWSEYPSWSTFGVLSLKVGGEILIDKAKGKMGVIEKKWNVDIELRELDYDSCILLYGSGKCDAVCITNMDILSPSLSVKSVPILPTSTSYGADACIVTKDVTNVTQLKGKKIYGLAKSVSEYCWVRNLELLKERESAYTFSNQDPAVAAMAMQQGHATHAAIVLWNPFVMETLNNQKNARVLFDSTTIPGEIIDMVVMSQSSLDKPGGKNAACAIIDGFYTLSKRIADEKLQDPMLVALGEKFSHLNAAAMKKVVRQTRFYATPEQGISLFEGGVVFPWGGSVESTTDLFTNKGFTPKKSAVTNKHLKEVMPLVVDFCVNHEMTPKKPVIGYGAKDPDATKEAKIQVRFDASYMKAVAEKK